LGVVGVVIVGPKPVPTTLLLLLPIGTIDDVVMFLVSIVNPRDILLRAHKLFLGVVVLVVVVVVLKLFLEDRGVILRVFVGVVVVDVGVIFFGFVAAAATGVVVRFLCG
jgi:hypothetical protein